MKPKFMMAMLSLAATLGQAVAEQPTEDELKALATAIEKATAASTASLKKQLPLIKRGKISEATGENMLATLKQLQQGGYVVPAIDLADPRSTLGSLTPGWGRLQGRDDYGFATVQLERIVTTGSPGSSEAPFATRVGGIAASYSTVKIKGIESKIPARITPFPLPPILKRTIDDAGESTFEVVDPARVAPLLPKKLKRPLQVGGQG